MAACWIILIGIALMAVRPFVSPASPDWIDIYKTIAHFFVAGLIVLWWERRPKKVTRCHVERVPNQLFLGVAAFLSMWEVLWAVLTRLWAPIPATMVCSMLFFACAADKGFADNLPPYVRNVLVEFQQAKSDINDLKARVAALEAAKKSNPRTADCDCGPDCVCPVCRCKPAVPVPQAQPKDSAVKGTDAPLAITITESTPATSGFERVKVCDGNSCRYEWRPMDSGAVQEAYRETQGMQMYEVPKRGLFGRRKWK